MFQSALSTLLQLSLVCLAAAAPLTTESHGNSWQYGTGGGILGLIVLVLDIIVVSTYSCSYPCPRHYPGNHDRNLATYTDTPACS